ncbi:AAA family ATPase [Kocuria sp. KH4]
MTDVMEHPTAPDPLDGAFTADWLTNQVFPPTEYVVPGLIPEGLTLLTAAPKIGKSWLVLGLGVAAATGGYAFGSVRVDRRPVLYLALEDGQRRLQNRLRVIGAWPGPAGLTFMTDTPVTAPATIGAFLDRHPGEKPLVVLDTLGKVRGVYNGSDAYGRDYAQLSALKSLVDAHPGSSLVVVHHTKKAETSDFLDSVSGTQGLAGAADSILVLRRSRHEEAATLHVTSRDAAEGEYAVTFSADTGSWSLSGPDLAAAARAVEERRATQGLGDEMTELVKIVNRYPEGIRRKDIESLMHTDPGTLGKNLRRAVDSGRICNPKRGIYMPATSAISATFQTEALPNVADVADMAPTHMEVIR